MGLPAGYSAALGRLTSGILRTVDGLATSDDPVFVELEASRVIGTLELDPIRTLDDRLALVEPLLGRLAARHTPDALVLAIGLRALLPDPWRSFAETVIAELEGRGVTRPAWTDLVGRATFEAAWAWTDEFGDQDMIVASFRYPGSDPHGISLTADHNFQGLFRQAAVGPDPDRLRQIWFETAQVPLRPITASDLATRWAAGTYWYRAYIDPPVYDSVPPLMALLEARAAALPKPRAQKEAEPMTDRERSELIDRFLASAPAVEAGLQPEPDGPDEFLVDRLLDFRENHAEGNVLRWSPIVVEIALLDWTPRKMILEADDIDRLPQVLRAFVRFAGPQTGLADEDVAETLAAIDQFEPQFRDMMARGEAAGPAARIARQMAIDGVDVTDAAAVERWIDEFNRRPLTERDDILGPLG